MEEVRSRRAPAEDAYRHAANPALSAARHDAARTFCEQLASSVTEPAMEGALASSRLTELGFRALGRTGSGSKSSCFISPRPSRPRPLRRIASGGELSPSCSRSNTSYLPGMMAVVPPLSSTRSIPVSAVPRGNAVARRLATLSKRCQVIVVTHLAQVAALADEHYVVSKRSLADAVPHTSVEPSRARGAWRGDRRMLSVDDDERALEPCTLPARGGMPMTVSTLANALCDGQVVIVATDTVYGLAALPVLRGYASIFELRRRSRRSGSSLAHA